MNRGTQTLARSVRGPRDWETQGDGLTGAAPLTGEIGRLRARVVMKI